MSPGGDSPIGAGRQSRLLITQAPEDLGVIVLQPRPKAGLLAAAEEVEELRDARRQSGDMTMTPVQRLFARLIQSETGVQVQKNGGRQAGAVGAAPAMDQHWARRPLKDLDQQVELTRRRESGGSQPDRVELRFPIQADGLLPRIPWTGRVSPPHADDASEAELPDGLVKLPGTELRAPVEFAGRHRGGVGGEKPERIEDAKHECLREAEGARIEGRMEDHPERTLKRIMHERSARGHSVQGGRPPRFPAQRGLPPAGWFRLRVDQERSMPGRRVFGNPCADGRRLLRGLPLFFCLIAALMAAGARPAPAAAKRNVLFIAVDDLRPQLGCYGDRVVKSPSIDRLAAGGMVFKNAYCQQAVCSPSRTSLLTGCRPDTTKIYNLEDHFRTTIPDVVTLPQHFKNNGYHSEGMGKLFHGSLDDPASWSTPHWSPRAKGFGPEGQRVIEELRADARAAGAPAARRNRIRGLPWEAPDVPDNYLNDGAMADHAIERLRALKDQTFFLGVGFLKPHLPFVAPKKYFDLYRPEQFKLAANPHPPKGSPPYALSGFGELRAYVGIPKQGPVSDEDARKLIHAYHACISYMDAQVGRVLDELDRLGLAQNTVVVLWGDHGWELGEHGEWCKHENYETSVHAPLILRVPGAATAGQKSDALVEFVDIYPTLAEACGLSLLATLEGLSMMPLVADPARPWKRAAISQYPRGATPHGRLMGYSLRTPRYRFIEWRGPENFREYELYDHEKDPAENENVAGKPEYAAAVRELTALARGGWKAALPPGGER